MDDDHSAGVHDQPRSRRNWCWITIRIAFQAAPLIGLLALYWVFTGGNALSNAIAATDAIDPNWRLADLQANLATVPEAENSALVILAGNRLIDPTKQPQQVNFELDNLIAAISDWPAHRCNETEKDALARLLPPFNAALPEFLKITDMPRGKYTFGWSPTNSSSQSNNAPVRHAAMALKYDFLLRVEAGDAVAAGERIKVIINAARSLGDEPFALSILARVGTRSIAIRCIDRWLAQCEPEQVVLAELQRRLEEEVAMPLLAMLVRGQRAEGIAFMEMGMAPTVPPANAMDRIENQMKQRGMEIAMTNREEAYHLMAMIRLADIIKLPSEQHSAAMLRWEQEFPKMSILAKMLNTSSPRRVVEAIHRSNADLRCTIAALAAERFRRQNDRWPTTLDKLVAAKLISAVPLDPFDGKPLRWKVVDDGRLIYSIGPDCADNDGTFNHADPRKPGSDVGLRLFDPARRRQPPRIVENKDNVNE